jgi:hypothetical protein
MYIYISIHILYNVHFNYSYFVDPSEYRVYESIGVINTKIYGHESGSSEIILIRSRFNYYNVKFEEMFENDGYSHAFHLMEVNSAYATKTKKQFEYPLYYSLEDGHSRETCNNISHFFILILCFILISLLLFDSYILYVFEKYSICI